MLIFTVLFLYFGFGDKNVCKHFLIIKAKIIKVADFFISKTQNK